LFHIDAAAASVAVLSPAVALYSVALRRGRLQQVAAGILAITAVVVADVIHAGQPTVAQTLTHVLLVAVPLLAAEAMRTHRANLRLLVERIELAEQAREQEAERRAEQERLRIARDLHDVVAHTLTEINVTAAAAAETGGSESSRAALEQIERASHDAIGELRGILGVLRGSASDGAPTRSPAPGVDDIAGLVDRARDGGIDARLDVQGLRPSRMSSATSLAAYRIVQESLTNVRRHAPGARTTVALCFGDAELTVQVDNGCGDGTVGASASHTGGVGIVGMRERAGVVGGRLVAEPTDSGFRVRAELPYEAAP
jgi:signal transduction histidine kinase